MFFFAMDPSYPEILNSLLNLGIGSTLTETLTWLHFHKVNLNALNRDDNNLMISAAHFGHLEVLNTLSDLGMSLTTPRADGVTPLMLAANAPHWEILQRMKELGVDLNLPNSKGISVAHILAEKGTVDIEKFKELEVDFFVVGANGLSPAFCAAQNGNFEIMRFILNSPNYQDHPFRSTKESLRAFANQYDSKIKQRMEHFLESKSHEKSEEIEMLPEEIALVMGHVDIVKLINTNRMDILESTDANSEELIARKLLFDIRTSVEACILSDCLTTTPLLRELFDITQEAKKQINKLNLSPKNRALFHLLIKDIEKEIVAIAPYHKMTYKMLELMKNIAQIIGQYIHAVLTGKSPSSQQNEALSQDEERSDYPTTHKRK